MTSLASGSFCIIIAKSGTGREAIPVSATKPCSLLDADLPDVFSLAEDTVPESSTNTFGSPLPVFRVKNVDASIAYYREALGFELRWRAGDGFACVAREKCSIFLIQSTLELHASATFPDGTWKMVIVSHGTEVKAINVTPGVLVQGTLTLQ